MPIIDPRDLQSQGDPDTVVYLPYGAGSLVGLYIKGLRQPTLLWIREDADGQPVSFTDVESVKAAPRTRGSMRE